MGPILSDLLLGAAWIGVSFYAGALLYAAASDLVSYEIPNWASLVALAAFLVVAAGAGLSASAIGLHLGLGALVLAVGFLIYLKGMSGAGDIKLLAAAAVWVGWRPMLEFLILIALAGGVLTIAILIYRRVALSPRFAKVGWLAALHEKSHGVPYGIAICAAALYLLPYLPLIAALRMG